MSNKAVVEAFLAASGAGDRDALAKIVHPDFEVIEANGLPYAGVWRGAEGFWKLLATVYGYWSDPKIEIVNFIGGENENAFAIEMTMEGRSAKNGTPFKTSLIEVWTVKDGKLFHIKPYYFDTKLMAELAK